MSLCIATHNYYCSYDVQPHVGSDNGVDACYTVLNTRGDVFGNCGHTTTDFTACAEAYVCIENLSVIMIS